MVTKLKPKTSPQKQSILDWLIIARNLIKIQTGYLERIFRASELNRSPSFFSQWILFKHFPLYTCLEKLLWESSSYISAENESMTSTCSSAMQ